MTRFQRLLAAALVALALPAAALEHAATAPGGARLDPAFRAPSSPAPALVSLPAPADAKRAAPRVDESGRLRVADVRALPKAQRVATWTRVAGGWVSRFTLASAGAEGLRARLDLGVVPGPMELRVQGDDGTVETATIDPYLGTDAWTPWTPGESQLVEIFSTVQPNADALHIGAIVHFDVSPFAKAAGACTLPAACSTGNGVLDSAVAEARKSVVRLTFVDGSSGFICSGTLLNTERFPAPYVATANHCINNADAARSISSWFFYENAGCDALSLTTHSQVGGGAEMVFTNYNVDSTVVQLNAPPPPGAVYAATNRARLDKGDAIVSLSHPTGDAMRLALGAVSGEIRILGPAQDFYGVRFSRGIIQHGSSGSGLFTLSGNSLQFRGVLSGTTVRNDPDGMSCTNLDEDALYGRFEVLGYELEPILKSLAVDDAPNRPQDLFGAAPETPLDQRAGGIARDGLRIDYAGDMDVFRFTLAAPAVVSAWSQGPNLDTVGMLLDSRGVTLEASDDAQVDDNHFGITRFLNAGTYYVQVGHFDATGTGTYNLRLRADAVGETNYTDLWSKASEPGWGLNVNHQGNTLFASLFTYDANGAPMWLVMSNGDRQPDGSYSGTLLRGTGSPFNARTYTPASLNPVGTMRIAFSGSGAAQLDYTVNGVPVSKAITRFNYAGGASCHWSAFDRTYSVQSFQDLWYVPAEPGWGLNISHQSDTLFASLFTYDENGRDLWLVMSSGTLSGNGRYSGTLYRTSGPAFNANPWVPATTTPVGTMSVVFSDGDNGTLSYTYNNQTVNKSIQRFAFGSVKPDCEN